MSKELLYFITDESGHTYSNDANGNLVTTSTPKPLANAPDGWQEAAIQYGRNTTYFGIVRSFTVPLGFVKLGARIARQLYYSVKGVQAVAKLIIAKYDKFKMVYEKVYSSALNFSTIQDTETTTTIQATDDDLTMLLKANESTTYDIPIDVPDAIDVVLDGMNLYSNVRAINYAWLVSDGAGGQNPDPFTSDNIFMAFSISDTETQYPSVLWAITTSYKGANSLDYDPADWLMQAGADASVRIVCPGYHFFIVGGTSWKMGAYIRSGTNVAREVDIIPPTAEPPTGDITVDIDFTLDLQVGDRVWLFVNHEGGSVAKETQFRYDNIFTFTYLYRKPPTVVKCLRPLYVLQQLVSKLSSGANTATSVMLGEGGEAFDYVLTSGDAVRGFLANNPVGYIGPSLKTSIKDFFTSFQTRWPVAISIIDNVLVFERLETTFQNQVIAEIDEVQDLEVTALTDHIFSSIKIGWPAQTYDDPNGKEEFNTTQTYTTPITRVSKELDLTSVYRADGYGIEFTRINLEGKTTTDSDSDNDTFMINIVASGGQFILNRPVFDSISGILAGDSAFNILLSPKRCLIEHGCYIRVGTDKNEMAYLTYQSTDKNSSLVTVMGAITITESADYLIGALDGPLFLPHLFQFNCKTPYNIVNLIEMNPNGVISFSWKGTHFLGGYIFQAGQTPANNAQQSFQLYAAVGNNMAALVDLNND